MASNPIANITIEFVHFVLDDVVTPSVIAIVQRVLFGLAMGENALNLTMQEVNDLELAHVRTFPLSGG